jgi:hypothetical protein
MLTCCLFRTQLQDLDSFNTEVSELRAAKAGLKRDLDAARANLEEVANKPGSDFIEEGDPAPSEDEQAAVVAPVAVEVGHTRPFARVQYDG